MILHGDGDVVDDEETKSSSEPDEAALHWQLAILLVKENVTI